LRFKLISFLFALLLFGANLASAAEQKMAGSSYSLEQLLLEAMNNHPLIQGKKNQYQASTQSLATSKWQRFPAVSVNTSAGQNSTTSSSQGVIALLRVEQPIWTGGQITGSIDAAQANMLSAEQEVNEAEQDLLIKTSTAFTEILRLQQRLEAAKESITEHQRLLELIQRRARNEVSAMNEIIFAKARLDLAKSERVTMESQLEITKSQLEESIGHPIEVLQTPKFSLLLPNTEEQAVKQTIAFSPTLKKFNYQIQAAEAYMVVAKSRISPQVSIRSDETYGSAAPGNTTYLALTYQPGNGLSFFSQMREAEAKKEVAETAKNNARIEIISRLRSDWSQCISQSSQVEILSNLAETTRGVYESYLRQYTVGRKTWVEVLNARKEATQAKYSLADAKWQSFIAGIRIQVAEGALNADALMMAK